MSTAAPQLIEGIGGVAVDIASRWQMVQDLEHANKQLCRIAIDPFIALGPQEVVEHVPLGVAQSMRLAREQ